MTYTHHPQTWGVASASTEDSFSRRYRMKKDPRRVAGGLFRKGMSFRWSPILEGQRERPASGYGFTSRPSRTPQAREPCRRWR